MTIRCCTARSIVLYMKKGASVADAVSEAVEDMRALKGGLISRVTIHAIDAKGNHKVVAVNGAGDNNTGCGKGRASLGCCRLNRGDHQRRDAADHDNAIYAAGTVRQL